MNLNVFIAKSGYCSRRDATALIKEGKVSINGKVSLEPWTPIGEKDSVKVRGKLLSPEKNVYLVFNKPKGVTSTVEDRFASKKVVDYIPKHFGRVYPVGRLDKESRGLMILTNDGELCYRMTHPKFGVDKEYIVTVKGRVVQDVLSRFRKGIREGDDLLRVRSAYIEKSSAERSTVKVIVREGKKRHIRRLFECLDFEILDLVRVRIGSLRLGDLREGEFKVVDRKSIC